ncbi:MAG: RpoL/Rpb11 RNA polymerase subunit family protein [Candidatus Thermoplasmatota archaeon]
MRFKISEKGKDTIRVQIQDRDETLFRPILALLMEDDAVAEVKHGEGHPQLDDPWLFIKVKKGKPISPLKRALEALSKQYKDARALVEEAL